MPGKVNPVIPEVVNQVAFRVIGNDLAITLASEAGQLELNVMEPIIVLSLFENIEMLVNAMNTLREKCIVGITANPEVCRRLQQHRSGHGPQPLSGLRNLDDVGQGGPAERKGHLRPGARAQAHGR